MKRFAAAVFDMDGVLADTEPLHYQAAREVLAAHGIDYTWEMNHEFFGRTTPYMFETLRGRLGLDGPIETWIERYSDAVRRRLAEPLTPADGVVELLGELRRRALPLALASSSHRSWIEATLGSLSLGGAFDVIVSGDMVKRGKPDPEIYLMAAERLGVAPAECVAVEDSPSGLASARAAGMTTVAVLTPYFEPQAVPGDHVLGSLAEWRRVFGG